MEISPKIWQTSLSIYTFDDTLKDNLDECSQYCECCRFEALLEAAGISRLSGESRQLADPEILRRLTSSVRYSSRLKVKKIKVYIDKNSDNYTKNCFHPNNILLDQF